MVTSFIAVAVAASITTYPGFIKPGKQPTARVEAIVHRGPISELIVRCPRGTAIISYSKVERLYCAPQGGCNPSLRKTVSRACR